MAPGKDPPTVLLSPSREQLLEFFDSMSAILQKPDVKQRIAAAVKAGDAVAVTTEIRREVFLQMGVDPKVGLDSLANVKLVYHGDRACIIKYLKFIESEELVREEAEMGQTAFEQKREQFKELQAQQLKLLHQLRNLPADVQEGFIQGLSSNIQGFSASTFFNQVTREATDSKE